MKSLEEVIKNKFCSIGKKRTRIFPYNDSAHELRYQSNALNFKDINDSLEKNYIIFILFN